MLHHALSLRLPLAAVAVLFLLSCKHEPLWTQENPPPQQSSTCDPDTIYFQQRVLPLIISSCALSGCHDELSHEEGLVLTSYANVMNSGIVVPFQPAGSKLYKVMINTNPDDRMPPPPAPALTKEQTDIIYAWILQGANNNSCQNSCDSSQFTYTATIRPMINNKCGGCHNGVAPQGGIDLSTYAALKLRVDDGKLWGSINHVQGYFPMPKNMAKLSDCELLQIKKWMDAGALQN